MSLAMPNNLFQHYVMGGGWVMLLLLPASIVAVATIFRVSARLWGRPVQQLANELRAVVLAHKIQSPTALTLTDARVLAADSAMTLYVTLQPLSAIYAVAPMLGALGTAWALGRVWRGPASLQNKNLAAALEQAFVPLGWGLAVGLLAITGYAILRARLVRIEQEILAPAALSALNEKGESLREKTR